jgi:hypothetical protein
MAPNLTGEKFGLLTVLSRQANDGSGSSMWLCLCECGNHRVVAGTGLRAGRNKSCGCASPRFTSSRVSTHGMSGSRTYRIWLGMHARCSPSNKTKPHLYYLKGIRVCESWQSFDNFLADMGEAPTGLTIERKNGDLGYDKSNCKWATPKEQANNTTKNVRLEHGGKSQTIAQWADEKGIKQNTLLYRLRRGWDVSRALTS